VLQSDKWTETKTTQNHDVFGISNMEYGMDGDLLEV
jgi:hypothetical protein